MSNKDFYIQTEHLIEMARDPQFVLKYLEEVELLAEDVLADKQQIVDLDKKRNFNREALAALHKKTLAPPHSVNKVWVNFGGVFVKMEKVFMQLL